MEVAMETRKKKYGTDRRKFLAGAGAALSFGAVAGLTACTFQEGDTPAAVPASGRIEHNPAVCAGCGVCGLMCSLYHENEIHVSLSRSELVREPFEAVFAVNVCRQCLSPSCYHSCPKKDSALCIDRATGVKYINPGQCDGCGKCTLACPLDPARVKMNTAKNIAFKCDLCRGREKGPICIEYCAQSALTLLTVSREV
jgi:Fe-S-cluster-containing hydrogenase component 2